MKTTDSIDAAISVRSQSVAAALEPARYGREPAFVNEPGLPVVPLPTVPPSVEQRFRLAAVRLEAVLDERNPGRDPHGLGRLVIVTSPERREGKTTTALHLATALAQGLGRRVALVETDRARPGLAAMLNLSGTRGLADVVAGAAGLDDVVLRGEAGGPLLVPGGEPNGHALSPGALLAPLNALREYHDLVLVDCAALASSADAAVLGRAADGVLLVLRAGSTTAPSLSGTLESLIDTPLVGTIINDLDGPAITRLPRQAIAMTAPREELEDD